MDDEEIQQNGKVSKITLVSYIVVGLFIVFFIVSPFLNPKYDVKIDILVSQNVEDNLNITCKTYFCENTTEQNFQLKKYKSKDIVTYVNAPKDKRCAIFVECIGGSYVVSKYAPVDLKVNEVKMNIAILRNQTETEKE